MTWTIWQYLYEQKSPCNISSLAVCLDLAVINWLDILNLRQICCCVFVFAFHNYYWLVISVMLVHFILKFLTVLKLNAELSGKSCLWNAMPLVYIWCKFWSVWFIWFKLSFEVFVHDGPLGFKVRTSWSGSNVGIGYCHCKYLSCFVVL